MVGINERTTNKLIDRKQDSSQKNQKQEVHSARIRINLLCLAVPSLYIRDLERKSWAAWSAHPACNHNLFNCKTRHMIIALQLFIYTSLVCNSDINKQKRGYLVACYRPITWFCFLLWKIFVRLCFKKRAEKLLLSAWIDYLRVVWMQITW